MSADLRTRTPFEKLDIRANGQVKREVANWLSVAEMSYKAWTSLERKVFQSAWIVCGYVDSLVGTEHMELPSMKEAQELFNDLFKDYGVASTPQRCTSFEWQIQVSHPLFPKIGVGHLFFCFTIYVCHVYVSTGPAMGWFSVLVPWIGFLGPGPWPWGHGAEVPWISFLGTRLGALFVGFYSLEVLCAPNMDMEVGH